MTRHVRLLGLAYAVGCGLALVVGAGLCVGLWVSSDARSAQALEFVGPIVLALSVLYLVPGLVGGLGVLAGRRWGRRVLLGVSVLVLPLVPVGTAVGAYGLWALRERDDAGTSAPDRRLVGLGLAAAGVASMFVVVLVVGFHRTGRPAPAPLEQLFGVAAAVLVGVIAVAAAAAWSGRWQLAGGAAGSGARPQRTAARWLRRRDAARDRQARETARRDRLAALAADPATRPYAERIARGEVWSDERIAYDMDPSRRLTCPHLQPVEGAMREAGLALRPNGRLRVDADCRVDEAALRRRFVLPATVRYTEPPAWDRSYEDPPAAMIVCDVCGSIIDVVHPLAATAATPSFPADVSAPVPLR